MIFKTFKICVISMVFVLTSCGAGQQREISERRGGPENTAIELTQSPYHAEKGWGNKKISFYVDAKAPDHVVNATLLSIETWNDAIGREVIIYKGRDDQASLTDLYSGLGDTRTTLYYLENWASVTGKSKDVLGTTVWELDVRDDQLISRSDIILNAEEYVYQDTDEEALDPNRAENSVDTRTVVTHEIGHMLGMNHIAFSQDDKSVMHSHALIGIGQYKRALSDEDVERAQDLYN